MNTFMINVNEYRLAETYPCHMSSSLWDDQNGFNRVDKNKRLLI